MAFTLAEMAAGVLRLQDDGLPVVQHKRIKIYPGLAAFQRPRAFTVPGAVESAVFAARAVR
jgi:hypothetical protein